MPVPDEVLQPQIDNLIRLREHFKPGEVVEHDTWSLSRILECEPGNVGLVLGTLHNYGLLKVQPQMKPSRACFEMPHDPVGDLEPEAAE